MVAQHFALEVEASFIKLQRLLDGSDDLGAAWVRTKAIDVAASQADVAKDPVDCSGKLGGDDELLDIAKKLEETALADDYFVERKLYPNVDFYTGLIYRAMGFPTRMFTVLFALGRLPGWIAHWREMMKDPATKIGRPRQIYTGEKQRDYKPLSER